MFSAFELHATLYYCAITTCVCSTVVNYCYKYTSSIVKVLRLNYTSNLHRNGTLPHVDSTYAMSEFDEYVQGRTTPHQQESSGAQTNKQRNAVARIETCPRLPAHTGSTVAILDSDVTLRYGTGLLHALTGCRPDGRPATGDVPVVSNAHDPCPADVDEDQDRKWQENDMYSDAWDGSRQAQSRPAGAVAFKEAGFTNPEIFRRGWESAGPPHPELLPDTDDSDGANATVIGLQKSSCLQLLLQHSSAGSAAVYHRGS